MKSINRIFYLVFFLSAVLAQSNQAKSTAAVLDFTGSGISNQEAQVLTERLGTELVQTKVIPLGKSYSDVPANSTLS